MKTPFELDDDERQDFVDNCEYLYQWQNSYARNTATHPNEKSAKEAWIETHRDVIDEVYDEYLNPCKACNDMPTQRGCPKHS